MNRHANVLDRDDAVLLIIDVQEKFRNYISDVQNLTKKICTLVEAAKILSVPIIVTEQYPSGLGRTIDEIAGVLPEHQLFEKNCFSCCGSSSFTSALETMHRSQIIVSGIEAHVCVNQTVHDLLLLGYQPHLITDAISSRDERNKKIGIKKMVGSGAIPSVVEMALFEMLVESGTDMFKAVQKLVK